MLRLTFKRGPGGYDIVLEGGKPLLVGRMTTTVTGEGLRYDIALSTVPGLQRRHYVYGYAAAKEVVERSVREGVEYWLSRLAGIAQRDDDDDPSDWVKLHRGHLIA